MFCERCGSQIADTDQFCPVCGHNVSQKVVWGEPAQPQNVQQGWGEPVQPQNVQQGWGEPVQPQNVQQGWGEPVQPQNVQQGWGEPVQPQNVQQGWGEPVQPQNVQQGWGQPVQPQNAQQGWAGETMVLSELPPMYGGTNTVTNTVETTQKPKKTKEKRKGLFAGKKKFVALGVVVALAAGVVCFANPIKNFIKQKFMSPQEYYQYVENKVVDDAAATVASYYGNYILKNLDMTDRSVSGEIVLELPEGLKDLLSMALMSSNIDISWLDSISAEVGVNLKDKKVQIDATVGANQADILSGILIGNFVEDDIYLGVPELNPQWLMAEDTLDYQSVMGGFESLEQAAAMSEVLPTEKQVEEIVSKYLKAAIKSIDNVEKGKTPVTVGDLTVDCTQLTVTLDYNTLQSMLKAILTEFMSDKETLSIICNISNQFGAYMTEDMLVQGAQSILDSLSYSDGSYVPEGNVKMVVYVDKDGDVCGRVMETSDEYTPVVSTIMLEKGSDFAYEFEVTQSAMNQSFGVEGSGQRSGDKLTGTYEVQYNHAGLVEISVTDYDTEKIKDGYLNGTFKVNLSDALVSMIALEYDQSMATVLSTVQNWTVTLETEGSEGLAEARILVEDGAEKLFDVLLTFKNGKGSDISVPKDAVLAEDQMALIDWVGNVDWTGLLDVLENEVGVPSELLNYLEMALGMF